MRRSVSQKIARCGVVVFVAGLAGCHGMSFGGGKPTPVPDESIENLIPTADSGTRSTEPSAKIHPAGELAVNQGKLQPKDRYAPRPPAKRVHVVRPGETLFGLARKYYGDQRQWRRIYQANRSRIDDPQQIGKGMKLIIP